MNKGLVYIAGCGPGNIDYITLKTYELIKNVDCIVYDALIDKTILSYAKSDCKLINVGKRKGHHSLSQDKINELLIQCSYTYNSTLRLKGGDPFVFGRGGEECIALENNSIPYHIIPGVTSAISVPENVGIPVTHRKIARSFTVITGHSLNHDISSLPFKHYASLNGTLVFLMGITHLNEIVSSLLDNNMDKNTPVSIIVNGTYDNEYVLKGTLETIVYKANNDQRIKTPGIIVIGEVASFDLKSSNIKSNKTIGIVGSEAFVNKLSYKVNQLGLNSIKIPLLNITPIENVLDKEIKHLDKYKHIVFTSRNTIDIFFNYIYKNNIDIRILSKFKFIVIGNATGEYLNKYHIQYDYCPTIYTSKALGELIINNHLNNLFIPRAKKGNNVLSTLLNKHNITFNEVALYDTSFKNIDMSYYHFDYLIFASSQGVIGYLENHKIFNASKIICIGEYTYKEVIKHQKDNVYMSKVASSEGIIELLQGDIHE